VSKGYKIYQDRNYHLSCCSFLLHKGALLLTAQEAGLLLRRKKLAYFCGTRGALTFAAQGRAFLLAAVILAGRVW
jgi:hypothetical protein